jgi:hypothetical protein
MSLGQTKHFSTTSRKVSKASGSSAPRDEWQNPNVDIGHWSVRGSPARHEFLSSFSSSGTQAVWHSEVVYVKPAISALHPLRISNVPGTPSQQELAGAPIWSLNGSASGVAAALRDDDNLVFDSQGGLARSLGALTVVRLHDGHGVARGRACVWAEGKKLDI